MISFWNFLRKNKLYGTVNIIGLTVTMAFVLLLSVYVGKQLTTDSFHDNSDRIYVVANEENVNMGYWMDKHLRKEFPEIEKGCCVAKISSNEEWIIDGEAAYGRTVAADSTFFEMFDYALVSGNREDWSLSWNRCMVSSEFANAHFPETDPLGRTMTLKRLGGGDTNLTICGVFDDFGNSILDTPDILVRGEVLRKVNDSHDEFMSNAGAGVCFVMTYPGADLKARHDDILSWCRENFWTYESLYDDVRIIPLKEMFFLDAGKEDYSGTLTFGNRTFVRLLLALCIMLLLFAVLNYVNMTTALGGFRAREMATRRLLGAGKGDIFFRVIGESTLMCTASMVLAVLLAQTISPSTSRLLNYQVSVFDAISIWNVLAVTAFIILLSFVSGVIPASLILRAKPIDVVRGTLRLRTKKIYSRVIIIVQNIVAFAMLVSSLVMSLQIRHMITANLGYNTTDVLVLDNNFGNAGDLAPFLDAMRGDPLIEAVGLGNATPLDGTNNWTVELQDGRWVSFQQITGDDNYFRILGLKEKQDNHIPGAWWLNEYAFKQLGKDEASLSFQTAVYGTEEIGGVYHDFKIFPLEEEQSAALIYNLGDMPEDRTPWNILVKTDADHEEARQRVSRIAEELFPGRLCEGIYMEEIIRDIFSPEMMILRIVSVFSLLSILLSAMGMFAMSVYHMQQEIQNVSVKKVFGASYAEVLRNLVVSFMKLVAIAFAAGVPVVWTIMTKWLGLYQHRIGLHWWTFVIPGLLLLSVSLLSVLYQAVRTAGTNPAEVINMNR